MRALAAKQVTHDQHGNEIVIALVDAKIVVLPRHAGTGSSRFYRPEVAGTKLCEGMGLTSLHRAKNAIRRYFGIESRRMMRWEEVTR